MKQRDYNLSLKDRPSVEDENAAIDAIELSRRLDAIEAHLPRDPTKFAALYNEGKHELEEIQNLIQSLETERGRIFESIPDLKRLYELGYLQASDEITSGQELEKQWLEMGLLPAQRQFWQDVRGLSSVIGESAELLARWTKHIELLKLEAEIKSIQLTEGMASPNKAETKPVTAARPEAPLNGEFDPNDYGGKELCIVVSYYKAGQDDVNLLARMLKNKAHKRYPGTKHPNPVAWCKKDRAGFRNHLYKLREKAKKKDWWDQIPDDYYKSYRL